MKMRKQMKKAMALLLGATIAASPATGYCAEASDSEKPDISEHVDLKMYLVGDKPEGFDDVYAEVNKVLEENLNCSLSVDWLNWSEHDTKYSLLFSGGEDFDLIFTASSWCHFEQTVALGGFKALDEDFIKTYAPDVWESLPEVAWDQATVDGNIYMIPANYTEVTPDTYAVRGDLMEQYGVEDISSYADIVDFYKLCGENGIYGNLAGGLYWPWFGSLGYQIVNGAPSNGELVLYNGSDPSDTKIQYVLDWDEFTEYCHQAKELADAGGWPLDCLSSEAERQDGLVTGRAATMGWNVSSCALYANQVNTEHPDWNVKIFNIAPDYSYIGTVYTNGGLGINAASKNAERAMMVINEFASNQELQDLTELGIEGVNWEAVGDDQYQPIEGKEYVASNCWGWRNMDLMRTKYQENPTEVDSKRAELEAYYLEHTREVHPLDGFTFNTTALSTQYAAVEAAMGNYFDPLICGLVSDVDASIEELRSALEAAGIQDVLDEMQRQADEYLAGK